MQTTSRMTPRANPLPFSHLDDAVAAAIRASRIDADLTQRQVAARLPWDVSVYIKRDAGRRRITVPQFILIAYALDRSPTDLLSRVLLEYSCHSSSMSRAENLQDMRAVRTAHRPTSAASITDTSLLAHLGKTIATVIRCYRIVTRLSLQDLADRSSLWTRPMVKNVEFGGRSVFVPEYRHRTCTEYNPRTIVDQSSAVVSSAGVVIDKYRDP
jgi:transcriptional regulator with XRE-family HTH domain